MASYHRIRTIGNAAHTAGCPYNSENLPRMALENPARYIPEFPEHEADDEDEFETDGDEEVEMDLDEYDPEGFIDRAEDIEAVQVNQARPAAGLRLPGNEDRRWREVVTPLRSQEPSPESSPEPISPQTWERAVERAVERATLRVMAHERR